ncbi:MAG TPA: hypothetical protein DDW84_04935 [Phycisphaerales bacterium]|nr:MAG: hypothetical protein A2Y13_09945 [Planctomycetes bacterium GWC2_45_44]HBG78181.1 hypothetical protein [Phycisphaerales bacterium]HBR18593.1 hypothetical protein [Phycisphaerales bacterium]
MKKVIFADSWKSILAENGLRSFDDFYHCSGKKSTNKNSKRNVSILRLKVDGEEKIFYMKRFRHPHFKDMLFTFLNCGKIESQAAYEFGNMNLLKQNNIGVCNPVCFGEKFTLGLERKSFIITESLPGPCLKDFIAQNWTKLPQSEKELLIASLAQFVRKVHKAHISLPDLYVWHLFLTEDKTAAGLGKYDFAVIDLNRMKRNTKSKNERIKNLGRLWFSMTDKYFDKQMRRLLVRYYISGASDKRFEKFARRVKKYAARVSAKRHPVAY